MSQLKHSSVASFSGLHYRIRSDLPRSSAAIAATHEEAHGIIRRSTLYGHLLSEINSVGAAQRDNNKRWAHILLSRGRTSDEVYATFNSITHVTWLGGEAVAIRELQGFPEYIYYYGIGKEFTSVVDIPYLKILVLEGLTRFCWSSKKIHEFLKANEPWSAIQSLPGLAFPDDRMSHLRKDWLQNVQSEVWAALQQKFPLANFLRGKSGSEVYDPLHSIKSSLPKDVMMLDVGWEINEMKHDNLFAMASMSEQVVNFVADYLTDTYEGTSLAALRTAEVVAFIQDKRQEADGKWQPILNELGIIEQVENLSKKRKPTILPKLKWKRSEELPIMGVRSWQSFSENFEVSETLQASRNLESEVVYATAYPLTPSARQKTRGCVDLPLALYPDWEDERRPAISTWMSAHVIVAVWTSIMLKNLMDWNIQFHELNDAGYKVWLVADTEPHAVIQATRKFLPEITAIYHSPRQSRPNVGGLVIRCLEDPLHNSSCVHGIVFPGLSHTLDHILHMIRRLLKDDFRGFNPLEFRETSLARRHEGIALVEWLIANEHTFYYRKRP